MADRAGRWTMTSDSRPWPFAPSRKGGGHMAEIAIACTPLWFNFERRLRSTTLASSSWISRPPKLSTRCDSISIRVEHKVDRVDAKLSGEIRRAETSLTARTWPRSARKSIPSSGEVMASEHDDQAAPDSFQVRSARSLIRGAPRKEGRRLAQRASGVGPLDSQKRRGAGRFAAV